MRRFLGIVWASPYTLFGLAIGLAGVCTGGRLGLAAGALEFSGGAVRWFVRHLPLGKTTVAFTLGHVILGQTSRGLRISRRHERVHVRQYERWGPLMGPAYLGCSAVLWLAGRHPYYDNPFERQAFALADEGQ